MTPAIRALPAVAPRWRRDADVVVVGSGAAGITAALTAAAGGLRVLMVTKDLTGGASPLAQGGLAAAIGPGDSPGEHARDTMTAGAGLCDEQAVAALAAGSAGAIRWLVARGARLERRDLRLEGGHSRPRIVHSGDDASGAEVHRALLAALLASPVEILDHAVALDLALTPASTVAGLTVLALSPSAPALPASNCVFFSDIRGKRQTYPSVAEWPTAEEAGAGLVSAPVVVLAAGGLGQAFATTSNPAGATGDAIAIAARAGAVLRDLEFVQFHPTVLWSDGATGQRPLITEALRGAGAVLRDSSGRPVMAGLHPRGDLAPRDVVAAAMFECIEREQARTGNGADADGHGGGHLWLDATGLGRAVLEDGFPTVTAACRKEGIDPVADLIPVAPGAHYSCGGIAAGLDGRTSIPGLYAVGEAASTGVHGANRLASNSLVEAVLMGQAAAESIIVDYKNGGSGERASLNGWHGDWTGADWMNAARMPGPAWASAGAGLQTGRVGVPAGSRAGLAAAMSRYAGVVRDRDGLLELLRVAGAVPATGAAPAAGSALAAAAAHAFGTALDAGAVPAGWAAVAAGAGAAGAVPASVPGAATSAVAGRAARVGGAGGRFVLYEGVDLGVVEATNVHAVSVLIATAALARTESRGCHRRRDAAAPAGAQGRHTLMRVKPEGLEVDLCGQGR